MKVLSSASLALFILSASLCGGASPLVVVPANSVWKYLADGTDPGTAWRTLSFNDAAWPSGPAQLGYGDGDETTVVSTPLPRPVAVYFRQVVNVPSGVTAATVRLMRDDGAVVYVNGFEVARDNMPSGPVTFTTLANSAVGGADESAFFSHPIPASAFVPGMNVIAVEVHQSSAISGDLSFALELTVSFESPPPLVTVEAIDAEAREISPFLDIVPDPAVFRISRTGGTASPLTLNVRMSGTASNGVDYSFVPGTATIAAGNAATEVAIHVIDDDIVEGTETVVLSVTPTACPECYVVNSNSTARAVILDDEAAPNSPPSVAIVTPASGAVFTAPADITVVANADDPDGYLTIQWVEFFANGASLGVRTNYPTLNPLGPFVVNWANVPGGLYTLTAVATDDHGARGTSGPVRITVEPSEPEHTIVSVIATDSQARESGGLTVIDGGQFAIRRTGNLASSIPVFFRLTGTAVNGVDYLSVSNAVVIPAGSTQALVNITPLNDNIVEPTETVVLTIEPVFCVAIFPPPPECYFIGPSHQATVFITDSGGTSNRPPVVQLNQPPDGVVFLAPANIHLQVFAQDPEDGHDISVEFFAGTTRIGQGVFVPSLCPAPYCPYFAMTWSNVPPGSYTLTARATDRAGATTISGAAQVMVVPDTNAAVRPVIVTQPQSQTVPAGSDVTFSVVATGTPPLSYRWLRNNLTISGASGPTLTLTNVQAVQAGTYRVAVTNIAGSVASSNAVLTVLTSPPPNSITLVPTGAVWKYHDLGADLGTAWRAPEYSDSAWASGPAQLGYGDADEATIVSFGPDVSNKYITTYFRRPFEIADASLIGALRLRLLRDDGAVVYLNGIEIYRDNMPAGTITYQTLASTAALNENEYVEVTVPRSGLVSGRNVVAAEVHQVHPVSSDIGFDLALIGLRDPVVPEETVVSVVALDPHASETGLLTVIDDARFAIRRSGNLQTAIPVLFSLTGSASNGVDYLYVSNRVVIPAGSTQAVVRIIPVNDAIPEGTETVVLTIEPIACIAIVPTPPECYLVGSPSQATVSITDGPPPGTNHPPVVTITSPAHGEVFVDPAGIHIEVVTRDPDGYADRIELFANGEKIGEVQVTFIQPPAPGEPIHFEFTWGGRGEVPPGRHVLTARTVDDRGASATSAPVTIVVTPAASPLTVTTVEDSGPGSLRDVIANAPHGATVNFAVSGAIILTSGELEITKPLHLEGPGADLLAIQRSGAPGTPEFRVFNVNSPDVMISGLTIRDGRIGNANEYEEGAGVHNRGSLVLNDCVIGGHTGVGEYTRGAGICNRGTLVANRSTFAGNTAPGFYAEGGAIYNYGRLAVTNCTFSGNTAGSWGGAIHNDGLSQGTVAESCTFTGNSASSGGGIFNRGAPPWMISPVHLRNTIVVGNAGLDIGHSSVIESGGYNLIGTIGDPFQTLGLAFVPGPGDRTNVPPAEVHLGALRMNGGTTPTHAILPPSLALDAGPPGDFPATDQRGVLRPFGPRSDVGAFEADGTENAPPVVRIVAPAHGSVFAPGASVQIRVEAQDRDGLPVLAQIFDGTNKLAEGPFQVLIPPVVCPDPLVIGEPQVCPPPLGVFHFEWTNAPIGSHTLRARAMDDDGAFSSSAPVQILVQAPIGARELHAVGVYSGNVHGGSSSNHEQGQATVRVDRPGVRVTLFLSSYEPVLWQVNAGNNTTIEKVILGGYYRQSVNGLPSGVPVINRFYEGGNSGGYLYAGYSSNSVQLLRIVQELCALTGLNLSSFQGHYVAQNPYVIDQVQNDERFQCGYPQPVDPSMLPDLSFELSFHGSGGPVYSRRYTLAGPVGGGRLLPAMRVVADAGGRYFYGTGSHEVWRIDSGSGVIEAMNLGSGVPELSWPTGIAFDSRRNRVLLVSLGGEGHLYAYSPASAQWSLVNSMQNRDVNGLGYHAADDSIYAVNGTYDDYHPRVLFRFNASGEWQGQIQLPPMPFDFGPSGYETELVSAGAYLVLLVEPGYQSFHGNQPRESRIYLIDPRTSQVWLTYRRALIADADGDGVADDRDHCPGTPRGQLVDERGCPVTVRDSDHDGVVNDRDRCPGTAPGAVVNEHGCSLAQICPCDARWPGQSAYVECVSRATHGFLEAGWIDQHERESLIAAAQQSNCGRREPHLVIPAQETSAVRTNGCRIILHGDVSATCIIDYSPDLIRWTPIRTNMFSGGMIEIVDRDACNEPRRFYRVRWQ